MHKVSLGNTHCIEDSVEHLDHRNPTLYATGIRGRGGSAPASAPHHLPLPTLLEEVPGYTWEDAAAAGRGGGGEGGAGRGGLGWQT